MRSSIRTAIVAAPLILVAGCTPLSAEDKAAQTAHQETEKADRMFDRSQRKTSGQ